MPRHPRPSLRAPGWAALRRGAIAAALVAAAGLAWLAASGPRVRFEVQEASPQATTTLPVNLLGNAVDDFAVLNPGALVLARLMEGEARSLDQVNLPGEAQLTAALDVDGDRLDEIGLAVRDSAAGTASAVVLRGGDTLFVAGPERDSAATRPPLRATWVVPRAVARGEGRGPLLLCSIASMFHRPRGVVAYDAATGAKRWYYATGAWPIAVHAADLDGDGRDEALVAGDATENRIADNGADDSRSWAIALDQQGRRLWQAPLGEGASHVQMLVVPRAGGRPPAIVASVYNHDGENPPPSRLVVLEPRTGAILHETTFPHRIGQPVLLDAARGTFVLGGTDGVLRAFDRELKPVAAGRAGAHVTAWGAADLLANGSPCVLASTDRDVLVLDGRLREMGRSRVRGDVSREPVPLALARAGLRSWRACVTAGRALVLDLAPVAPLADGPRLAGVAGAALLAGALAAAWRRRPRRLPPMSQAREFLVDYRQVRHDVFDEVRPFGRLWNWAHESVAGAPPPAGVFAQAKTEYLALGEPALRRFADRARELWVDDAVVRRIRDRLDALAAALREGGAAAEDANHARAVAGAMRELSDACAAAYREVATREPCRADEVVFSTLAAKRGGLAGRSVAIELRNEPGGAVPVLFGADDLRSIVGQFLENSAAALRGHDDPRVRVTVAGDGSDPRRVRVRVEDNGPGIPHEDRERVFRPDVSSREGGGFGLGHARETARGWRGDVVIEDASWGAGVAAVVVMSRLLPFEEQA